MSHLLVEWGWDEAFQSATAGLPVGGEPARVVAEHYGGLEVICAHGSLLARTTGLLRREIARGAHPRLAVGDFVWIKPRVSERAAAIEALVPRRNAILRRMAGSDELPQPVCANVDLAFIVVSADEPPNLRRLERFLSLCATGGVSAQLVIGKCDLVSDVEAVVAGYGAVIAADRVAAVAMPTGLGLEQLAGAVHQTRTYAFIGPSGVGKTTLTNFLVGGGQFATQTVRYDGKGKHTTTSRHLVKTPSGALLIDTPGLREVGLLQDHEGVDETFPDVSEWARQCRFSDCQHSDEPDCAVRNAVEQNALSRERFEAYLKLQDEMAGGGSRRPERKRKR